VAAAKLQEELAAEMKSLQSEGKEEPSQDGSEEKHDESLKNEAEHVKEDQTLPNGEVVQDEDEGVDLRGSVFYIWQQKVTL
jgi:Skp family chaperone for outer membrane proteins